MNLSRSERIKYFNRGESTQNFGDFIPQYFEDNLIQQPRIQSDVYRLIGSVIDADWLLRDLRHSIGTTDGTVAYWGCGMRDATPLPDAVRGKGRFFGVRGPLTRDLLGLDPEGTPLGDTALLLPVLYEPKAHPLTAGKSICMPHIHDTRTDDELLEIAKTDLIVRPSIQATEAALLEMLDKICSASFVLSNALHGAICAAAYGRPFSFWKSGHLDCPFKWQDFAASIGHNGEFATDLAEGVDIFERHGADLRLPPAFPILACCPFEVNAAALVRAVLYDHGRADGSDPSEWSLQMVSGHLGPVDGDLQRSFDQENAAFMERRKSIRYQGKSLLLRQKESLKRRVVVAFNL